MDMDSDVLRWFQMVADGATVTEVAEVFMVGQPHVSRSLAALQREVGAQLLVRSGRVLRPTHAGVVFKRHVDRAIDELDDGLAAVDQLVDPERGTVTLAYEPSLGSWLVPLLVGGFRGRHPGVGFVLRQLGEEGAEALDDDSGSRIDLALTAQRPPGTTVQWHRLFREPLLLALPPGHRLSERADVGLAEVAGDDFVLLGEDTPLGRLVRQACQSAGFEPHVVFETDDLATVRGFVAAGLGVGVVPATGIDQAARPLGPSRYAAPLRLLRLVPLLDHAAARDIGLAWSGRRRLLPSAELFRQHVLSQAGLLQQLATS